MSDPSALIGSPIALALLIVILTSAAVLVWYYRHSIFVHEPLNLATELRVAWYLAPYYVYLHSKRILGSWYKGRANAIDLIEASVKKYPTHTALVFASTGQSWTYLQMNADINKAANFLYAQGVRPGHVVALFIENSPQFIFAWLGLLKLGATAAFLNPNLQGASLVHVLKVSGSSKVIVQASPAAQKQLLEAVLELSASNEWEIYHFEDKIDKDDKFAKLSFTHIDMESLSASAPDPALKDSAEFSSPAMLIYTSGTTGLPKAAYISHSRFILAMCAFSGYIRITQADRLYSCLPLYHASAAMAGFGAVARSGATLILVPKFSARNFFPECKKYHVTMIHYIGELARFLISVPVNAAVDTDHHVKTAFGNGMRPDIWLAFKKRFGIKAIAEFYASTEGTAALANYQNNDDFGVGAMGRQGLLQSVSVPLALIRFDQVQEEPIRDAQGRCTRVLHFFP